MAHVVVDASVLIAIVTNGPEKVNLIEMTQDVNLISPHSVHWEIGNAFSAMFKRNRVSFEDAIKAIAAYQEITIRFVDIELDEALKLAYSLETNACDAYLIRCAIKYRSPLISLDKKLLNNAKSTNVKVLEVTQ